MDDPCIDHQLGDILGVSSEVGLANDSVDFCPDEAGVRCDVVRRGAHLSNVKEFVQVLLGDLYIGVIHPRVDGVVVTRDIQVGEEFVEHLGVEEVGETHKEGEVGVLEEVRDGGKKSSPGRGFSRL